MRRISATSGSEPVTIPFTISNSASGFGLLRFPYTTLVASIRMSPKRGSFGPPSRLPPSSPSSRWYQRLLGCQSAHGGAEYERLVSGGTLILQLHHFGVEHHHGAIGDPKDTPYGNGVLL